MVASNHDPYLYPGTKTLKNKFDIEDPAELVQVQDEFAAQRYFSIRSNLPRRPFTFDTLKNIHRHLFQDVFEWAGQPRIIGIRKAAWDEPESQTTWFAEPMMIEGLARSAFKMINQGRSLMGLDRMTFAARAAEFLNEINLIHPFREGNGRAQRLLLTAIGAEAGW